MPTFTIVSQRTDPLGPNEIPAGGVVQVSEGDVFIIDPTAERRTTFESEDGTPTNFTIEIAETNDNNFSLIVGEDLTPTITIADNVSLTDVDLDAEDADAVNLTAGDNVTFGRLEGSTTGPSDFTFGNGFTTTQNIAIRGGDNSLVFGDDATIADINSGNLADTITFGARATIDSIQSEDGNDTITIGDDSIVQSIRTEDGDDTVTLGDNVQIGEIDGGRDNDTFISQDPDQGDVNFENTQVVCYAPDTMIETALGPRQADELRPGDMVLTLDDGYCPITWVRADDRSLDGVSDDERPILIAAHALGAGLPKRDLIVSPQHRIFVGGHGQLEQHFPQEALVPAKALTGLPGIRAMRGKRSITWVHFALQRHHVVRANSVLSESLYLGRMVLNGLRAQDRARLEQIYAPMSPERAALNGPPARPFVSVQAARRKLSMPQPDADPMPQRVT